MRTVLRNVRVHLITALISIGWLLGGCREAAAPTDAALKKSVARHATLAPSNNRTYDDELEDVVKILPSFGGVYINAAGRLVVRLTAPEQVVAARPAIKTFLEKSIYPGQEFATYRLNLLSSMIVEPAQYNFAQLRGFFRFVTRSVLGLPDVMFADIDEQNNRILVGVTSSNAQERVGRIMAHAGIPRNAIAFELVGANGALDGNLTQTVRPTASGHRIRTGYTYGECTLGYNLNHWFPDGTLDPNRYLVTASHCTPQWGGGPSSAGTDTVGQATHSESIAVLAADRIYVASPYISNCPTSPTTFCRYSDTAIYRYLTDVSSTGFSVPWPTVNTGSLDYFTSKQIYGQTYAMAGDTVHKLGQASGLTSGTVAQTCLTVYEYNRPPLTGLSNKAIICAFRARYASSPGDSGGPVLKLFTSWNGPSLDGKLGFIGIHFQNDGFYTWYSGWSQILNDTSNEIPGDWWVGP